MTKGVATVRLSQRREIFLARRFVRKKIHQRTEHGECLSGQLLSHHFRSSTTTPFPGAGETCLQQTLNREPSNNPRMGHLNTTRHRFVSLDMLNHIPERTLGTRNDHVGDSMMPIANPTSGELGMPFRENSREASRPIALCCFRANGNASCAGADVCTVFLHIYIHHTCGAPPFHQ
ncbi:hypothetical protein L209DRAFT_755686 [Thermothelomyces heterothallicus CBS 203.75]